MDDRERLREASLTADAAFALAEVAVNLCMVLAARVGLPGPEGQESPGEWMERLLDSEQAGLAPGDPCREAVNKGGSS